MPMVYFTITKTKLRSYWEFLEFEKLKLCQCALKKRKLYPEY